MVEEEAVGGRQGGAGRGRVRGLVVGGEAGTEEQGSLGREGAVWDQGGRLGQQRQQEVPQGVSVEGVPAPLCCLLWPGWGCRSVLFCCVPGMFRWAGGCHVLGGGLG